MIHMTIEDYIYIEYEYIYIYTHTYVHIYNDNIYIYIYLQAIPKLNDDGKNVSWISLNSWSVYLWGSTLVSIVM